MMMIYLFVIVGDVPLPVGGAVLLPQSHAAFDGGGGGRRGRIVGGDSRHSPAKLVGNIVAISGELKVPSNVPNEG